MAGPHAVRPPQAFTDPVLSARLEALQLLADQVSERIIVLDQDFTILYANRSAWPGTDRPESEGRPAKCYEAFVDRSDPCEPCPALEVSIFAWRSFRFPCRPCASAGRTFRCLFDTS